MFLVCSISCIGAVMIKVCGLPHADRQRYSDKFKTLGSVHTRFRDAEKWVDGCFSYIIRWCRQHDHRKVLAIRVSVILRIRLTDIFSHGYRTSSQLTEFHSARSFATTSKILLWDLISSISILAMAELWRCEILPSNEHKNATCLPQRAAARRRRR